MVNQLLAKVMSLAIQRDRMWQMVYNIDHWLAQDDNWRLKLQTRLKTVLFNLHDEDSTETTQAFPSNNTNSINRLKEYDEQVIRMSLQSQKRKNLQRYRIRTVIEKSLVSENTSKSTNNKNHEHEEGFEL